MIRDNQEVWEYRKRHPPLDPDNPRYRVFIAKIVLMAIEARQEDLEGDQSLEDLIDVCGYYVGVNRQNAAVLDLSLQQLACE